MRFALAAVMAVFLCAPAYAEKIGGINLICSPAKDRTKVEHSSDAAGFRTVNFDAASTLAFLDYINAVPPVTHLHADTLTVFRSSHITVVGFNIGIRFCMAPEPFDNEDFDKIMVEATGRPS